MSRAPPVSRCVALLRAFDKDNIDMVGAINTAAAAIEANLSAQALADLNEGQFAALIDFVIWKGINTFKNDVLFVWVEGGNLTLPPTELATHFGTRGAAERDMWNLGNSE